MRFSRIAGQGRGARHRYGALMATIVLALTLVGAIGLSGAAAQTNFGDNNSNNSQSGGGGNSINNSMNQSGSGNFGDNNSTNTQSGGDGNGSSSNAINNQMNQTGTGTGDTNFGDNNSTNTQINECNQDAEQTQNISGEVSEGEDVTITQDQLQECIQSNEIDNEMNQVAINAGNDGGDTNFGDNNSTNEQTNICNQNAEQTQNVSDVSSGGGDVTIEQGQTQICDQSNAIDNGMNQAAINSGNNGGDVNFGNNNTTNDQLNDCTQDAEQTQDVSSVNAGGGDSTTTQDQYQYCGQSNDIDNEMNQIAINSGNGGGAQTMSSSLVAIIVGIIIGLLSA